MMSGNWKTKQLGDICDIQLGKTPSRKNKQLWDEDKITQNVWLSVADLKNTDGKFVHDSKEYVSFEGKGFCKPVKQGTLLVSFKLTLGRLAIAGRELYTNEAIAALSINDEMMISKEYLYYYLHYFDWDAAAVGKEKVKGKTLNKAILKTLEIRFPPLGEQQRIVSILDEAFPQISVSQKRATANVAAAEELFSSSLYNTITIVKPNWLESTIDQLAEHRLGKMLDKNKNTGSLRPYLRNKNVRWFGFDLTDVNEMKFEDSERSKYTAIAGDLLICEGGYPGRAAIWNDTEPVYFQKALHRVRFNEKNHTKWFLYYLYYLDLTEGLRKHFTGTGIQHFTGKSLAKMSIPIAPSGEIDSKIMMLEQFHSEVKKLTQLNDDKMAHLTKLKHSLLLEAFSGKLTGGIAA
mgnify:CR=1 FL=1